MFWLDRPPSVGLDERVTGLFVLADALRGIGWDEPESLILAQSERWRHA